MVKKAPTLKKYVPYISRKKSSGGSSRSNAAKQSAINELNQKVAQLNRAIDEGRYSDATGSLKEEYSQAKSKAQSVGAIIFETDAQIQARLEQARQDFIKQQQEQAKAARARLELQASRAAGTQGVINVPKGSTIQLETRKIDLKQPIQENKITANPYGQSVSEIPFQTNVLFTNPVTDTGRKGTVETIRRETGGATSISEFKDTGEKFMLPSDIAVDTPSVATLIDRTIVPAKTISEDVYLPDARSVKKYNDLLKQTTVFVYDEQGRPIPNPNVDLRGGSKLSIFLREQQAELRRDQARYNLQLKNIKDLESNPKFKRLQDEIKTINDQIEQGKEFTEQEANAANKKIDEYNKLYNQYDKAFQELNNIQSRIEIGYRGTGKDILKQRIEQLPSQTKRIQGTLTRGVLVGGIAAYDVSKTALAAQTAASLITPVVAGTSAGQAALATIAPVGKLLGSQKALGISASAIGTSFGLKEYQRTGDVVYGVGAGLGAAGGFLGSTAVGQSKKSLSKKQIQQLQKAESAGKGYIYKDKGQYKIVTFENRRIEGIDSNARTVSTVKKVGDKWIITDGKGTVTITDKQGNIIDTKRFVFDSTTQKTKDSLVLKGQVLDKLKNVEIAKGDVIVEIGNKAIKNQFLGVGIKDGSFITSYVDNFDISKARQPSTPSGYEVRDIKIGKPGEAIDFNLAPRYMRQPFNPKGGIQFEQINKDNVRLLFGGADDSQVLSKFTLGQLPTKGTNRVPSITPKGTVPPIKPVSYSPNINQLNGVSLDSGSTKNIVQLLNKQTKTAQTFVPLFSSVPQAATQTVIGTLTPTTQGSISGYASFLIPSQKSDKTQNQFSTPAKGSKVSTKSVIVTLQDQKSINEDVLTDVGQTNASGQASAQVTQTTNLIPAPSITPPQPTPPRPSVPQRPTTGIGVPNLPELEREYKLAKGQGYNAEYVPEGQRQFKKINTVPQTLMSALSTMAKKVDNKLSARGRVVKAKPKVDKKGRPIQPLNTGDKYFERNQNKFRTFRSVRGRKGALQNGTFIERQSFRLDTPGEKRQIKQAKNRRTPFGF